MIRRHFSVFLFFFHSFLGLALLSWSADNLVQSLRYAAHYLVFPLTDPPLAALSRLGEVGRNLSRLIDLDRTYRELEAQGLVDKLDRLRTDAVESENRRLRELLDVSPLPRFTPIVARIWSRESSAGLQSLMIRRGSKDGLRPTDPVLVLEEGREAVVGQVAEVFPETARVLLLADPSSAVSAVVPRTGEQGAVEGGGPSRLLLNYLFSDTDVRPGDEVVTAGLGDIFPRGLLLGTVRAVEPAGSESFRRARVAPAARIGRISEVLVLRRVAPAGDKP